MQTTEQGLDELSLNNEKSITKQFEQDEHILITTKLSKYNERNKKQERTFMLTNKFLYNISKTSIKRKISTRKIQAMTVSKLGNEFVIHVPDEYDYRYSHPDKRDKIVEIVSKLYLSQNNGTPIKIYYRDEINLDQYTTKKGDIKKGIRRMPFDLSDSGNESDDVPSDKPKSSTLYSKESNDVDLNDFALLKVLGRGAFGKVMLVKKKDTQELFALKSMKKAELVEKDQLEHTKTEKMILEHVNHPFLARLDYCFQTKEKIFFVMQFMKGGELFQHLRKEKRFQEERAKFYGAQIALGLGHLHGQNIIYRDMKPENVLMDENGYVSLTDFGMAKILKQNMLANSFCGTPEYLAPEIITGEGHGKQVDWWGLGILMYELMIGIPPFYHQNQNMMFQLIRDSEVRFPSQIPLSPEAKDFISKCLIKDQKKRLGSQKDIEEIKTHSWFKNIDWVALLKKEIIPPYKPTFKSDFDFFDPEFTSEDPINSYGSHVNPKILEEFDSHFTK